MTRLFVATLVVTFAICASADETVIRTLAEEEPAVVAIESQPDSAEPDAAATDSAEPDVAATDSAEPDAAATDSTKSASRLAAEEAARQTFHPVLECDCETDPVRIWRDPWTPCDTTNQWCDHGFLEPQSTRRRLENGEWVSDSVFGDITGPPQSDYDGALRFGWWSVWSNGSQVRTGEFQNLQSSPFVDFDTRIDDGTRSLDLTMSVLNEEANDAHARFYGPNVSADIRYLQFLRIWDHDPMAAPDVGPPVPPADPNDVVSDDLNVGQDYAIRVQTLNAKFKGNIADNLSWKVNVWGMRKFGERQANATGHCFDLNPAPGSQDNRCHVLSQRQQINWVTSDIQPVLEARFDGLTLEYSHTFRSFGTDDQMTLRQYSRFGYQGSGGNGTYGAPFVSNFVPESMTNIDRLKISAEVSDDSQIYANMYIGNTHNEFRDTSRDLNGYDVRLTNRSIDDVTLTAYSNMYNENNQLPSSYFNSAPFGLGETSANVDHPLNYNRSRNGLKGDWKPFDGGGTYDSREWDRWRTFRIAAGYEYQIIARDYATYESARLGSFSQPDTKMHNIEFGPSIKWTPEIDSYVRYKGLFAQDPIVGIRESQGRFNTNQPEQLHRVELGGTWTPTRNFMMNGQFSIVNSWNDSFYASKAPGNRPINFSEDSYPFSATAWWAPTEKLSLTAGYSYLSNFVDQDITVGFRGPDQPGSPFETTPWSYQGTNQLVSLSAAYAWTPTVNLLGGFEWDLGNNFFDVPPMTDRTIITSGGGLGGPPNWSQLPSYSAVKARTLRLTTGIDWHPYQHIALYTRYVYFDWEDISQGTYSGDTNMLLAGGTVLW